MGIQINKPKETIYPIKGVNLQTGVVYEGSDGQLYVGTYEYHILCIKGERVLAVGINHLGYGVQVKTKPTDLTFREIEGNLNYK